MEFLKNTLKLFVDNVTPVEEAELLENNPPSLKKIWFGERVTSKKALSSFSFKVLKTF